MFIPYCSFSYSEGSQRVVNSEKQIKALKVLVAGVLVSMWCLVLYRLCEIGFGLIKSISSPMNEAEWYQSQIQVNIKYLVGKENESVVTHI